MTTWFALSAIALTLITLLAGSLFYQYYVRATYEKWIFKSDPKYPPPSKVKEEIIQMTKGMWTATLCPVLALHLSKRGWSRAYCGLGDYGWSYLVFQFFLIWLVCDFFEFFYHYLGHKYASLWEIHKHHHNFFNPSPFAVIADEYPDQFIRASPLFILPLLMPINMDLLWFEFALFFYLYGLYLHWGHECTYPDAHHPWLNSSYHHYLHHAISSNQKPYHTGFMFKIWDRLFGSIYQGECRCCKCDREKGNRTHEIWEQIEKPDYSILLSHSFWFSPSKLGKSD